MNLVEKPWQADVVRRQADRLVDEFPNDAPEVLAADAVSDSYKEEGVDIAVAIAAELLRRAASGVRKWPAPANEKNAADDFERKLEFEMDRILSGAD